MSRLSAIIMIIALASSLTLAGCGEPSGGNVVDDPGRRNTDNPAQSSPYDPGPSTSPYDPMKPPASDKSTKPRHDGPS